MPKQKKKFIDKNKSVTFHLVHRSQKDPLVADETAPQHVLMPQSREKSKKNTDEEHKYGIFFDDEYDYLQHLKSSDDHDVSWEPADPKSIVKVKQEKVKKPLQLPSSVFASKVEESVGLLNRAAPILGPRPDLDPDVIAALDDDFDFDDPDNLLEDNFVELANQEMDEDYEDDGSDYGSNENYFSSDEMDDEVPNLNDGFRDVETKSRFTDYSMSSSVIRRNEQLTLLDNRFEEMFKGYEENEIGALDCDEIEGTISAKDQILVDLAEKCNLEKQLDEDAVKEKVLATLVESSDEELDEVVIGPKEDKWDCESILSTYSNLYNHPAKICEPKGLTKIRISKKTGVPLDVIGASGGARLTAHNLAQLGGDSNVGGAKSIISMVSELSIRPKDESPEERKLRKQNLKAYRKERRVERKANTMAFKEEKTRQEKVLLNLKNNLQGVKIL